MKILILTNKVPYPPKDGGAIATFNITKGFANLGNEVSMLAINTNKHYVDIEKISKEIEHIVKLQGVYLNTDIRPFDALSNLFFSRMPYNAIRFISKEYEKDLIKLLQKEKFDIVQIEGLYMMPYLPIVRKYSDAFVGLRSHNVEWEIWERASVGQTNFFKKKYIKILAKRIKNFEIKTLNQYDAILPITARDAKVFEKYGNTKPLLVTPTGINSKNLITKREEIEFPSLFHIGGLDWLPNQEGLVWFFENIWQKIIEKHPNLKFYIAGRNAPNWLIEKLKSYKNTIYCGEVESAVDFMNSKAIMVVPLKSGSGMRIKIIEGMALGKTIVSTSIGTEGIGTTHKENIMIANSENEFINSIDELLSNKNLFEKIGETATDFIIKNFDNINISKSVLNFYEQLLSRKQ